ncbi:hypothetical protein ACF07M_30005 [Streptomyces globisporus]|uniref:hypothetical protein n=1 Tax=Streptomyces globisporus TaxID=1908 RepID=UPI0036F63647
MARLQILELPEGAGDDRPPFILVIDEYVARRYTTGLDQPKPVSEFDGIAEQIGARAVLVFEDAIDIPANDTSAFALSPSEPAWTQTDEIQARATEAVRAARERTDIARDMDRFANHKAAITDALGLDRLRDWDDIRNAARGLRRERDAQAQTLERIRRLPEEPQSMEPQHHGANGYEPGYRAGIVDAKNVTYPPATDESGTEAATR